MSLNHTQHGVFDVNIQDHYYWMAKHLQIPVKTSTRKSRLHFKENQATPTVIGHALKARAETLSLVTNKASKRHDNI